MDRLLEFHESAVSGREYNGSKLKLEEQHETTSFVKVDRDKIQEEASQERTGKKRQPYRRRRNGFRAPGPQECYDYALSLFGKSSEFSGPARRLREEYRGSKKLNLQNTRAHGKTFGNASVKIAP
jgi:hypothetical protein